MEIHVLNMLHYSEVNHIINDEFAKCELSELSEMR